MTILEKLGNFFSSLAIPGELAKVFEGFVGIWEAIPLVLRSTLIGMFSVACLFAVLKMLF